MTVQQFARLADLPNRPPRENGIGRKLEALGLLEPTDPEGQGRRRPHAPRRKRPNGDPRVRTARACRSERRPAPARHRRRPRALPAARRQEHRARRPRGARLRGPVLGDRRAPRDAGRDERPRERDAARHDLRDLGGAARYRRPQRRGAGDRRQDGLGLRRAAQHRRQGRGGGASHRRPARSRRASCARSSAPGRASCGSSARSRRSSRREVHRLGIPGVGFLPENKRVYPNAQAAAHVLGFANVDNVGIAGIEKYIDGQGCRISTAPASTSPPRISSRSSSRSTCASST